MLFPDRWSLGKPLFLLYIGTPGVRPLRTDDRGQMTEDR